MSAPNSKRPDVRFESIVDDTHYYCGYVIVSRRGVIVGDVFWRKRDADAELGTPNKYRDTDRVARVRVTVARRFL
jgi:hypothetical protein